MTLRIGSGRVWQRSFERWDAAGRPPAEDSIAKIKALSKSASFMRPKPIEHWLRVLAKPGQDPRTYETAKECLKRLGWSEREPGEDDEELAA